MKTLIINQKEAAALLPMRECIAVMEQAFRSLSDGKALQPLRNIMRIPSGNILASMPSFAEDLEVLGAKIITVFPGNHGSRYDAHQGVVLLYETRHGCLQAIVDATAITGIRTAAVSAVATKLLANPESRTLAILGAGTQAKAHLEAMSLIFDLETVRVWSIYQEEAEKLASEASEKTGLAVRAVKTAEEAVEGSDLICTTTPAREPILQGTWIKPGTHINAIGACTPSSRELDTEAVRKSSLYVDKTESALNEAGDFIIPKNEGAVDDSHIRGEIGNVLTGKIKGRSRGDEITLFKAVGLAVQDLAAACYIFYKAEKNGTGREVEIAGGHFSGDL